MPTRAIKKQVFGNGSTTRYLDKKVRTLDVSGKLIKEVVVEAVKATHTLSQVPKKKPFCVKLRKTSTAYES